MVLIPLWTLKRFVDAKAAWQRVRGGERDARTHGRFVIHGRVFGIGAVCVAFMAAIGTASGWPAVVFLVLACSILWIAKQGCTR
jgi:hypothetical protein